MTRPALHTALAGLDACAAALAWATPYGTEWERALAECPDHRWMTWLAGAVMRRGHLRREAIVLCACAYARTALRYVPAGETRPLAAIETAERWARGEATLDEVRAAADAAADADDAAAAAAYAAAAYAAADAAADAADAAAAAYAYAADAADADAAAWAVRREARAAAEVELLAITRRELGPALLAGLAEVSRG